MAAMTEGIKTALVSIGDQLSGSSINDEVKQTIGSVMGQMFVIVDVMARVMGDIGIMAGEKQRMDSEIKNISFQAGVVQGAVDTIIKQNEDRATKGGGYRKNNVLESKAVTNMKSIGSDKTGFRSWHEKLVNIMEQIRPGSRSLFKALTRHVEHEVEEDFEDWIKNEVEYKDEGHYKEINEDLYVLLMDKSETEALTRVRSCPAGEGLQAYRKVYK